MKKIIITAISAIAVIASVIGCQIYDSQTNDVLFSAMNALGEGSMSKEDYIAQFNIDCKQFVDASSDLSSDVATKAYDAVMGYYFSYSTFYTTVKGILADDTGFTGDDTKDINSVEDVKSYYKKKNMPIAKLLGEITEQTKEMTEKKYETVAIEGFSITEMYDKQYQLKWDWNSKKGR